MSPEGQPERRIWWRRLLFPGQSGGPWRWRVLTPVVFACAGLLAATSATNARGTDLRGGRNDSLIEVVSTEKTKVESLQQQSETLQKQVNDLSASINGDQLKALQQRVSNLQIPAGVRGLRGPGLVVTLTDAPRGEVVPDNSDPNVLLVHQQDIQAVANALWAGGAEGISLQGNRIISTTGIKCVGNTVVLQGVPYAPPYRIVAVGNVSDMYRALVASPEVQNYRDYVPAPYNLGWSVRTQALLTVPSYAGPVDLQFAEPGE